MEIKICGITKEYEIDKLIEEKIEYAGFVLYYPKSKRNNTIERAQQLLNYLKSKNYENEVNFKFFDTKRKLFSGIDINKWL